MDLEFLGTIPNVTWLCVTITTLFLLCVVGFHWETKRLPPGISGFSAISFLIQSGTEGASNVSLQLLERLGDIVCVKLFNIRTMIFLGNHDLMKEAFQKAELADRPNRVIKHGLIATNGPIWKEQRRFALSTLREFGMGKIQQEERIIQECQDLVLEFSKHNESFDPKYYLGCAVTNIICSIIFSDRFNYDDELLEEFFKCITENVSTPLISVINAFPLLRHFPVFRKTALMVQKNRETVMKIVKKYVDEHKKTFDENHIRDYIDSFLAIQVKEAEAEVTTFTDDQLMCSVFDLFVAGSETTGTTLRWALALMALHPDIQAKVHNDIDENIGHDRLPKMGDKLKMTYTEAVLLEAQRYASVVPIIGHRANHKCEIKGYGVEPGNLVFINILRLHKSEVWPYPNEFNVKNFFKDGEIINRNYFVAFSVGKRSCIGESLAKMEIFLLFVSLMQKYTFSFDRGHEPNLERPITGIVRAPEPYRIRANPRESSEE